MCLSLSPISFPTGNNPTIAKSKRHGSQLYYTVRVNASCIITAVSFFISIWKALSPSQPQHELPPPQQCPLLLRWFLLGAFRRLSRNFMFMWNSRTISWSLLSSTLGRKREDFCVLRVLKPLLGRPLPLTETYQSLSALALRLVPALLGTVRYRRDAYVL